MTFNWHTFSHYKTYKVLSSALFLKIHPKDIWHQLYCRFKYMCKKKGIVSICSYLCDEKRQFFLKCFLRNFPAFANFSHHPVFTLVGGGRNGFAGEKTEVFFHSYLPSHWKNTEWVQLLEIIQIVSATKQLFFLVEHNKHVQLWW